MHDGYKIEEGFKDRPLDLSNFLLLRSRMNLLLQNRLSGAIKNNDGLFAHLRNKLYQSDFESSINSVRLELDKGLDDLHKTFAIENKKADYPVAFATNAMYVLAREDGQSQLSRDIIEQQLIPVVKAKADYLHGEGLSQIAYALNEYQIWDEDVWSLLKERIPAHSYDYIVVKNISWSLNFFSTHSGAEHFGQRDVNSFGNQLFFKGKSIFSSYDHNVCLDNLNVFEMFNALDSANKAQPQLGLGETVAHVSDKYSSILFEN